MLMTRSCLIQGHARASSTVIALEPNKHMNKQLQVFVLSKNYTSLEWMDIDIVPSTTGGLQITLQKQMLLFLFCLCRQPMRGLMPYLLTPVTFVFDVGYIQCFIKNYWQKCHLRAWKVVKNVVRMRFQLFLLWANHMPEFNEDLL